MRILLMVVGFVLALTGFQGTPSAGAHEDDAASVDAAFKQGFATGNIPAVLDLFAADAVEVNPFGVFGGLPAIRNFTQNFAATPGLTVSFSETAVVLNTAVHLAFISSDPIRATGVSRIVFIHTLVVVQGRIQTFTGAFDLSDPQTQQYAATLGGG